MRDDRTFSERPIILLFGDSITDQLPRAPRDDVLGKLFTVHALVDVHATVTRVIDKLILPHAPNLIVGRTGTLILPFVLLSLGLCPLLISALSALAHRPLVDDLAFLVALRDRCNREAGQLGDSWGVVLVL